MNETIEKEMDLLLNNFWITKEQDKENYYLLKKNQNRIANFVNKNLGNKLIVHDRFIKLEKIPAVPNEELGISVFIDSIDYVMLFLFLLYLEGKTRGELFILSDFTEYIKNTAITLELSNIPDWNLSTHRKSLVRVVHYLEELNVILLKDGDSQSFQDSKEADALYVSSGISNYLLPAFDYEIFDCNTPEDFLKKEWGEQTEEKGDVRRYKVYRHLLYEPAILKSSLTESENDYIKKMRKTIESEIQNNLNMEVEITKNLGLLYASVEKTEKDYFPNSKKITNIILLVNEKVIEFVKQNKIQLDEQECFRLTKPDFYRILKEIREDYGEYFSKKHLDLSITKYQEIIIQYMKNFYFLTEEQDTFLFYPVIYRYLGKTKKENKKTKTEQLELMEV